MYQYIVGRTTSKIDELSPDILYEDLLLSNERKDSKDFVNYKVNQSTFANMGFRKAKFNNCNFQHCVFIDCYFKDATFDTVAFVGCKFIDCNFDSAMMSRCDFRYAIFRGCYIEFEVIKLNLPLSEPNLQSSLCINLGMESRKLGNIEQYKKYYFEEQRSSLEHHKNRILQPTPYYKNKYGLKDKISSIGFIMFNKLSDFIWGYGENAGRVVRNIAFVAIVFTIIYCIPLQSFFKGASEIPGRLSLIDGLYLSLCSLFTLSVDIFPNTFFLKYCIVAEGGLGIILMGFFIAALFRSINNR